MYSYQRYILTDRCIHCGEHVYFDTEEERNCFTCECGQILPEKGGELASREPSAHTSTDSFAV